MRFSLVIGIVGAALAAAPASDPVKFPFPVPQISSAIPRDAEDPPAGFPRNALRLQFFDDYSWRIFIALNWNVGAMRGYADKAVTMPSNAGLRVWEDWKGMFEIFPDAAGEIPDKDWNDVVPLDTFCAAGSGRRIAMSGQATDLNQTGASAPHGEGPLIDRDARYVQYEIRVNSIEFRSLIDRHLYLRSAVDAFSDGASSGMSFGPDSIEVKAAWKEIGDTGTSLSPAAAARYFQTTAMVLDPATNTCVSRRMALIALHIVQKTAARPQWIWSSFEHVDLLSASGPLTVRADNPTRPAPASAPKTPCKPEKQTSSIAETASPALITAKAPWPALPTKVARLTGISDCTQWTNQLYQTALTNAARTAGLPDPVWANYALVATQWPNDAFNSSMTATRPAKKSDAKPHLTKARTSVANIGVETYKQTRTSCMACHDLARGTDFVWFPHLRVYPMTKASLERSSLWLRTIK